MSTVTARIARVAGALAVVALVAGGPAFLIGASAPGAAAAGVPASGFRGGVVASAPAALGGYTLTSTATGLSVTYEQPNLPIPANPSLEADAGYSYATFDAGPVGQAVASTLYPGQVAASAGGQLGAIIPGAPALPDWPIQAHSKYPQGPTAVDNSKGPAAMRAATTPARSQAQASLGSDTGAKALPAGFVTVRELASSALSEVTGGAAAASGSALIEDLRLAGGLVSIGSVTTRATGTSNGRQAVLGGSTVVARVEVAGQPVTVTSSGVKAAGHDVPIGLFGLTPLQVLKMAGISMTVSRPTDTVSGAAGSRRLGGLIVQVNLGKYDAGLGQLIASLPSQISQAIYTLPIPVPDEQVLTIYLASASVSSNASPAYVPPPFRPPVPPPVGLPVGTPGASPSPVPIPSAGSGGGGYPSSPAQSAGAPAGAGSQRTTPSRLPPSALTSAAVPVVFRGIGLWLVLVAGACVAGFAWLLVRADKAIGAGVAGAACRPRKGK